MARYLNDCGALIQHIPRTGGTWIEKVIGMLGIKHMKWLEKQPLWLPRKHSLYQHYYRNQLDRIKYIFSTVRHPKAYYESQWKWLCRETDRSSLVNDWRWHPQAVAAKWFMEIGGRDGMFDDWVVLMTEKEPMWYTRLVENYVGPEGGEFVDFIARTETLSQDFYTFLELMGYDMDKFHEYTDVHGTKVFEVARINVATATIWWSPDTEARVMNMERMVIERFYEKEDRCYASLAEKAPVRWNYAKREAYLKRRARERSSKTYDKSTREAS